ncbi:MAG: DNRLRE domain-containing protein [Firmicutes bacterium]|nr:DNRLRE domain-containing protein [Bacillota bacterium]
MRKLYKSFMLVLTLALVCMAVNAAAAEVVLNPVADTFVRDGDNAAENFGDADRLELKWESDREGMTRISFIKFDISDITAVEKATLRLWVEFSDVLESKVIGVYDVTGEEWSESELTWENAPLTGGTHVKDLYTDNLGYLWLKVDLTEQVKQYILDGVQEISIRLENKSDHWGGAVFITSKEGENNHPELVIVN